MNAVSTLTIGELVRSGAILAIQDGNHGGSHPKASEYVSDGIPFIMASDISGGRIDFEGCKRLPKERTDRLRIGFARPGDVLLTHKGTVGEVAKVPEVPDYVMLTPQVTYYRVDPDKLDPTFLALAFREPAFQNQLASISAQSTRPYVAISTQQHLRVRWQPVDTQRRIAGILGAYDDLIDMNRRRVAVLEAMARGLFEEWFVRFRFPGHEDVPLQDTPNGPLPKGWEVTPLGSMLHLVYGKALKSDERVPGEASVIGSSGVVGTHSEALVKGPGIVVGRKGNVGSVIWSHGDFWPIDTTYYVDTDLPLTFVEQLLRRIPFQNTDAAVPGLNRDYALSRVVTAPPRALIDQYGAFAGPLRNAVETIEASNRNLAASRDLLLPRLISGELSVEAAQRELEAA